MKSLSLFPPGSLPPYAEINECLSLWKLRHVEFMTAKDDAARPVSYWLRRRDPFTSYAQGVGGRGNGHGATLCEINPHTPMK